METRFHPGKITQPASLKPVGLVLFLSNRHPLLVSLQSEAMIIAEGDFYPMVGLFPMKTSLIEKQMTLGYVTVEFSGGCLLSPKGTRMGGPSFIFQK